MPQVVDKELGQAEIGQEVDKEVGQVVRNKDSVIVGLHGQEVGQEVEVTGKGLHGGKIVDMTLTVIVLGVIP